LRGEIGERIVRDIGAMFRTIGLQLGYRYEDSPICVPDGTTAAPDKADTYIPSARPGARAPHVGLRDGRSILDLFGHGFTLLQFNSEEPDGATLQAAAAARGVPFRSEAVPGADAASLYERRLALVRPDGHVAWRGDTLPVDLIQVMDRIRGA
jgi:hypothetical protein